MIVNINLETKAIQVRDNFVCPICEHEFETILTYTFASVDDLLSKLENRPFYADTGIVTDSACICYQDQFHFDTGEYASMNDYDKQLVRKEIESLLVEK